MVLLGKEVRFKELGIMRTVVREQKFGVYEMIESIETNVDCLTLTAHTIPVHFSLV